MLATAVEAVRSVAATEWDGLVAPGDLFCGHAWLRHLDEAVAPHSAVLVRRAGVLAAALPLWDASHEEGTLFRLPELFPHVPELGRADLLWAGARRAVRNGVLSETGPTRSATLRYLLAASVDHARECRRDGVIIPYLPVRTARELAAAHPHASLLLHSAEATVHIPQDPASDPRPPTTGHNRKRRRRELRDFAATGHTLEWTGLTAEVADRVAPLIANTRAKHGSTGGVAWMRRIFDAQRRAGLDAAAATLLCRREDALVAAAVCYRHGNSLHGRYFGADESAGRAGAAYFVTTCHAPVVYARAHGLHRVHLSTSALEAKVRRGATVEPLAAVVLLDRDRLHPHTVEAHNRKFAAGHRDRFSDYAALLDPRWLDFID
ncbi:peptidogalycan biosysnthesis protein [Nocardia grenadensis]|uniref:peptidogalycan biosysnthesis protein n=1 Tax=Nocardia grenadensis TaxID=931537 RepID=UPI000B143D6A|nr:peptidogalycan biosysnthesis protein [Nocardia grenadensis]